MLSPRKVEAIVLLYREKEWTVSELADLFGMSDTAVSKVLTGRAWKEVTGGANVSRYGKETEYRCAVIQARLEQGCRNYQKIADELGITRQAVRNLVVSKGLGGQ